MIKIKKPKLEALKEVGRWLALYLASSLIIGIEAQLDLLPEYLKVGSVLIDVRQVVVFGLTFAGRYLDKLKHEKGKVGKRKKKSYGLIPF